MQEGFYYAQFAGREGEYVGDYANESGETWAGDGASNGQRVQAPAGGASTSLKMPKLFKPDEPDFF